MMKNAPYVKYDENEPYVKRTVRKSRKNRRGIQNSNPKYKAFTIVAAFIIYDGKFKFNHRFTTYGGYEDDNAQRLV